MFANHYDSLVVKSGDESSTFMSAWECRLCILKLRVGLRNGVLALNFINTNKASGLGNRDGCKVLCVADVRGSAELLNRTYTHMDIWHSVQIHIR